ATERRRNPSMSAPTDDERPEFRIAVFGMQPRYRKLLEIVVRHARNGRYRFAFATSRLPGQFDLALIDMTAIGSANLASALARVIGDDAIVRVGRRSDTRSRRPDDLLLDAFVAQVLRVLERVSDRLAARRHTSAEALAADSGLAVQDFGMLRQPRALI